MVTKLILAGALGLSLAACAAQSGVDMPEIIERPLEWIQDRTGGLCFGDVDQHEARACLRVAAVAVCEHAATMTSAARERYAQEIATAARPMKLVVLCDE